MGHDISGHNKAGEEIAYARFSKGNWNARILYGLLDANDYDAGVSGTGECTTFSIQQIEKAVNAYMDYFNSGNIHLDSDILNLDQKQIRNFILDCLATAQKEESVKVCFG